MRKILLGLSSLASLAAACGAEPLESEAGDESVEATEEALASCPTDGSCGGSCTFEEDGKTVSGTCTWVKVKFDDPKTPSSKTCTCLGSSGSK